MGWREKDPISLKEIIIGGVVILLLCIIGYPINIYLNGSENAWQSLIEIVGYTGLVGLCGIIFLLLIVLLYFILLGIDKLFGKRE